MKRVTSEDYTSEYFEYAADRYREGSEWARNKIDNVLPLLELSKGDIIADIGCGIGTFALESAKEGYRVYAVDYSPVALGIARQLAGEIGVTGKITFILSSVEKIPIDSGAVDKVVSANFIEHLYPEQFDVLLRELSRIIKDGGCVVLYAPNPHEWNTRIPRPIRKIIKFLLRMPADNVIEDEQMAAKTKEMQAKYDRLHVHLKSAPYIRSKLKKNGFKVIHEKYVNIASQLKNLPLIRTHVGGHILIRARKV
ncbi:SAM-dependent methyltransferase [Chloroflexota bacterium]